MKKLIYLSILIIFWSCKKEPKSIPTTVNEVEKTTISEQTKEISKQAKETFSIVGNKIWIRETPKTGKVAFTLDGGAVCEILEQGVKDTIRGTVDFWYKVKANEQVGWVFGSQTSKSQKMIIEDDFKPFLKDFLQTCFSEKNTDSLLHHKSPIVYKYIHKEVGFTRYHNPGITCVPEEYDTHNYRSHNYRKIDMQFYPEEIPKEGFCDESTSKNGIYYSKIKELPKYPVFVEAKNDFKMVALATELKYKNAQKKEVIILHKKWIIKRFYFIKTDGKWWLTLVDDCDCSA